MLSLSNYFNFAIEESWQNPPMTLNTYCYAFSLGSSRFARRYFGNWLFSLFLWVLRCFTSPGIAPNQKLSDPVSTVCVDGFPHSDIFGSTVARHLPEAYRSHATSFIAYQSQGIHHLLINMLGSHFYFLFVRLDFRPIKFSICYPCIH